MLPQPVKQMLLAVCIILFSVGLNACGKDKNAAQKYNLSIAWSNMAVTNHFWAALIPGRSNDAVAIGLVNLDTGERNYWKLPETSFNSLSAVPETDNQFLVTGRRGKSWFIFKYDAITDRYTTVFRSELELREAFELDDGYCALSPTEKTQKQAYSFRIVCNKNPVHNGPLVETYSIKFMSKNRVVFYSSMYAAEKKLYEIKIRDKEILTNTVIIDSKDNLELIGMKDQFPYFLKKYAFGKSDVYKLLDENLVADDGPISLNVAAEAHEAFDRGKRTRILMLGDDRILSTYMSKDSKKLIGDIWHEAKKISKHEIGPELLHSR